MKVKELIEILSKHDQEAFVITDDYNHMGSRDIDCITPLVFYKKDGMYWDGIVEEDGIDESMAVNVIYI